METLDGLPVAKSAATPMSSAMGGAYFSTTANVIRARMRRAFNATVDISITWVTVFRTTTATTNATISALGSDSGGSGTTLLLMRTTNASAAKVNFLLEDSNGNIYADLDNSTTTINDGRWHCHIGSGTMSTLASANVYVDGALEGTLAPTAAPAVLAPSTFQHVCAGGTVRGGSNLVGAGIHEIALVVPIIGRLTDIEGISLSSNPWQLLTPEGRRYVLAGAPAAGGAPLFLPEAFYPQALTGLGSGLGA